MPLQADAARAVTVLDLSVVRCRTPTGKRRLLVSASGPERSKAGVLGRLENEYSLREFLTSPWAPRPLALTNEEGAATLVLEDPGGTPLEVLMKSPLTLVEKLCAATAMAGALAELHASGIIHKDIKPADLLVNLTSGLASITGFCIATRLPRERHVLDTPNRNGNSRLHGACADRAHEPRR